MLPCQYQTVLTTTPLNQPSLRRLEFVPEAYRQNLGIQRKLTNLRRVF